MDHDQRFKELIRDRFADFIRLFFAAWARQLDLDRVEWLDKEIFPLPPEGNRFILDLVAKVHSIDPEAIQSLILVLLEVESPASTTSIDARFPDYYAHLRIKHRLPVLPVVLFLKVGLDGTGKRQVIDRVLDATPMTFEYTYVALPGLEAVEYVEGENPLGWALAALMHIADEDVVRLGAEALKRIAESGLCDQSKFMLGECVDAYLPADESVRTELKGLLKTERYREAGIMNVTTYERGIEKGRVLGMLESVLDIKFGKAGIDLFDELKGIDDSDFLREVTKSARFAGSIQELQSAVSMR